MKSDNNRKAALSELEGSKPKAPARYVMSGLAKEAMEVRHELAAFVLDRYGVTDHAELRTRIDSLLIMFDQLVEHPKEQGAEPYAWTVRGTRQMYFGEDAEDDARMEAKKIGGTAVAFPLFRQEQGAEPVDPVSFTDVANLALDLTEAIWPRVKGIEQYELTNLAERCIYKGMELRKKHVAPTAREKAMEEAGDAMDELLDGPWHIYDENREKAISVWRAAKSTK